MGRLFESHSFQPPMLGFDLVGYGLVVGRTTVVELISQNGGTLDLFVGDEVAFVNDCFLHPLLAPNTCRIDVASSVPDVSLAIGGLGVCPTASRRQLTISTIVRGCRSCIVLCVPRGRR